MAGKKKSKIEMHQIINLPIESIKLNEDNPRHIDDLKFKKLINSIKEFPEMLKLRPIIINEDNIVLGGNMRLRACHEAGLKEIPCIKASSFSNEQEMEFIIKDNLSFGSWDYDKLANEWESADLERWGLDTWQDMDEMDVGDSFSLPNGEKEPFQDMTFHLADEQAREIKQAIEDIKAEDEYKFIESFGNENSNGNALFAIIRSWAGQKK